MLQRQQHFHTLLDDPVRLAALQINDEAHAARVMLVARVVESLLTRRFYRCHR